jgi:hypothetical protein
MVESNEKKDKRMRLAVLILMLAYILGMVLFQNQELMYNRLFFGFLFAVMGLVSLFQRLMFDFAKKDKVIGELVRLELDVDSEGSKSYTPFFQYRYLGEERLFKSNISSITFRKLLIGSKEELWIRRNKPSQIRVNRFWFHAIEYGVIALFLCFGVSSIIRGLGLLG